MFDWPAGRWLCRHLGVRPDRLRPLQLLQGGHQEGVRRAARPSKSRWIIRLGQAGYTAQVLMYIVLGYFFIQAAVEVRP